MSTQNLFEMLLNEVEFDLTEYLDTEDLSDYQTQVLEKATEILKDNTVGEIQKIGGNFKKNEDKFKQFVEQAEKKLDEEKYKESKKELKKALQYYTKKLREVIAKTCFAVIPVKEMPWVDVIFRNAPRIMIEEGKAKFVENLIAYYGEIKCVISRTTVFAKMKDADPLFAPVRGELDLKGYEIDDSEQIADKAKIFPYVSAILESLDANTTRSQVAKYHEGYQRHGEPICDFLMKDEDLMDSMKKLTTGAESGRTKSDIAVSAIAIPHQSDNETLLITVEESKEEEKYANCFEALLKFSAACCEAPSTKTGGAAQSAPAGPATIGPSAGGTTAGAPQGGMRTPGGQNLSVWSAEELAEEAQKRGGGGVPPDMEVWSEDDLAKMAQERGSGIPEGMEVWSEEDLEELKKERQGGGLNIPEWEPDNDMKECANCGYGLRKGWSECPVCGTSVGTAAPPQSTPEVNEAGPESSSEAEKETPEPTQEVPEKQEEGPQNEEENNTNDPAQ